MQPGLRRAEGASKGTVNTVVGDLIAHCKKEVHINMWAGIAQSV